MAERCDPPCGNRDDEPTGYMQWHDWAASMNYRGHTQSRCPKCGYYTIWSK